MARINIDDLYSKTITENTDFELAGGQLFVGEWGDGLKLQFLSADGYSDYVNQSPGAVFRTPSTGKLRWIHTADSSVSIKNIEQ